MPRPASSSSSRRSPTSARLTSCPARTPRILVEPERHGAVPTVVVVTDTFPRQYARTQRLTLGEPRNVTVSPDGRRVVFLRSSNGGDPVNCAVGARHRAAATSGSSPTPRAARRATATTRTCPPRNGPAASGPAKERGGITSYATDRSRAASLPSHSAGGSSSAGCCRGRPAHSRSSGPVFDPRPDPLARRVGLRERCDAAHRRTRRVVAGCSSATANPTPSPGAAPTSSPPRRWADSAATGGARTATPSPCVGSTPLLSANG